MNLTVNKDSFQVTTPTDHEIRMTRLFDAPRRLVFEVMSRPEHVKRWWGNLGEGYSVPVCEIDLRVGGKWRFVNQHPGGEAAFHGEYLEIVPPETIVWTFAFDGMEGDPGPEIYIFEERDGRTTITSSAVFPSSEVRDAVLGSGMLEGAEETYDRLDEYLRVLASRNAG